MKVLAVTGWSGTGKTTLIVELIRHCVARGERVAAIKHTHHEAPAGEGAGAPRDTDRFRDAGALPVILASGSYSDPSLLLKDINADVVLIEGFKSYYGWPRIDAPAALADALLILDRIDAP